MPSGARQITATFEIVTPMFLGGADQQAGRIRESSIKGALAFWWRALNYAQYVEKAGGKQTDALKLMQKKEQQLFGGPEGQGIFLLKVVESTAEVSSEPISSGSNCHLSYIARGLLNHNGQCENNRNYIKASNRFTLKILLNKRHLVEQENQLINAIKIFGLLGGLGSRARRGWGSVSLYSLEVVDDNKNSNVILFTRPDSREIYIENLQQLFKCSTQNGGIFNLSAFAKESQIRVGTKVGNPTALHNDMAQCMQRFRGWYAPGEQNFKPDHHWFKHGAGRLNADPFIDIDGISTPLVELPKRGVFGLPHNYYSPAKNGAHSLSMSVEGDESKRDRRASPLLFHVQKIGVSKAVGVMIYLPTRFLASKMKIKIKHELKEYSADYSVIEKFLDGKQPDGSPLPNGPYFPSTRLFPHEEGLK